MRVLLCGLDEVGCDFKVWVKQIGQACESKVDCGLLLFRDRFKVEKSIFLLLLLFLLCLDLTFTGIVQGSSLFHHIFSIQIEDFAQMGASWMLLSLYAFVFGL